MPKILTHRKSCRFCNSRNIKPALRFEPTPLEVFTGQSTDASIAEERQQLIISVCDDCKLVQLLDVTDPGILHRDNSDEVPISPATASHYESYAHDAVKKAQLKEGDLGVDIGSGNGALKQSFLKLGMKVVTVDPAKSGEASSHYSDFFTPALAGQIVSDHGNASLVTANYVMGSVDNMHAFIAGVRYLLKPEGLFIAEEPYLADIIQQSMFDTINHKRLSFITAGPFDLFLKSTQMHLIEAKRTPFRRGTLHMTIQRGNGSRVASPDLIPFIADEKSTAFYSAENMNNFAHSIEALKNAFRKTIADLKATGNKIAGYGATGRTITFILECGWQSDVLEYIVSTAPHPKGTYLAGTQIPIVTPDALVEQNPSHVIIFSYHDAEYIMEQSSAYRAKGGKFIVPFPGLKIV